jgi:NAD(P)-dependent dehydrogenase (short-subunit alcohol dehydrogenase family)
LAQSVVDGHGRGHDERFERRGVDAGVRLFHQCHDASHVWGCHRGAAELHAFVTAAHFGRDDVGTWGRNLRLDGAVNNAGVMDGVFSGDPVDYETQKPLVFAPIHEATEEYWSKVFHTNALGTFLMMRAQLKQLVAQLKGGAIVNVGSIAGLTGLSGNPAYVASTHAVNGLTRNAAIDYAPYGIRVTSVNMAATATPMTDRAFEFMKEAQKEGANSPTASLKTQSLLMASDSQKRMATVWEQGAIILFLLSADAANLTGGTYATDGGWTAY